MTAARDERRWLIDDQTAIPGPMNFSLQCRRRVGAKIAGSRVRPVVTYAKDARLSRGVVERRGADPFKQSNPRERRCLALRLPCGLSFDQCREVALEGASRKLLKHSCDDSILDGIKSPASDVEGDSCLEGLALGRLVARHLRSHVQHDRPSQLIATDLRPSMVCNQARGDLGADALKRFRRPVERLGEPDVVEDSRDVQRS